MYNGITSKMKPLFHQQNRPAKINCAINSFTRSKASLSPISSASLQPNIR